MSGRTPEEHVRLPVLRQRWRRVLFLHWRYPPCAIARLLPAGLRPDLHDGDAWVSLVLFDVEAAQVPPVPPLPGLSDFPETNLRTYVRGPGDVDGLWFLDLEVASLPTAVLGSVFVPYHLADMVIDATGDTVTYRSRRRADRTVRHHVAARHLGPLGERGQLDDWLTGRWRSWTRLGRSLVTAPVQHEPWPLHDADLISAEETLLVRCGLPAPGSPALVHASPGGVDARLGLPRRAGPRG